MIYEYFLGTVQKLESMNQFPILFFDTCRFSIAGDAFQLALIMWGVLATELLPFIAFEWDKNR